jgi:hypothetical protein
MYKHGEKLSTLEFDISKWLVKRLVKLRIHKFTSRFAMFESLHSIESFHSITIFERLHAIIPARVIIHFPLHFTSYIHYIFFNPNSPIKPTRLIYKIFGQLYIFIVSIIFPTLSSFWPSLHIHFQFPFPTLADKPYFHTPLSQSP